MQSWFGSSGGGLPRRPELKSLGRFLFACRLPALWNGHLQTLAGADSVSHETLQ